VKKRASQALVEVLASNKISCLELNRISPFPSSLSLSLLPFFSSSMPLYYSNNLLPVNYMGDVYIIKIVKALTKYNVIKHLSLAGIVFFFFF
jgi:hypothetical protein